MKRTGITRAERCGDAPRARTLGAFVGLLAAGAGCGSWTTYPFPAEPVEWEPPSGPPPELVLDGTYDEATGDLVVSLSAVLPAGSPAPRVRRCEEPGPGGGAIVGGVLGLAAAGVGAGLLIDTAARSESSAGPGWFDGMSGIETAGGTVALVAGLASGLVAVVVGAADVANAEAECFLDAAPRLVQVTTSPTTVAVDRFTVRVVRADGSDTVLSVTGPAARIALEPAPFACPGECVATAMRRARAGRPPENSLRRERLTIEAIPEGELFDAHAAPTATGIIDVTLMP